MCTEFIKVPRVEKCNRLDDLAFFHLEIPRVVSVRQTVLRSSSSVRQNDDISASANIPSRLLKN